MSGTFAQRPPMSPTPPPLAINFSGPQDSSAEYFRQELLASKEEVTELKQRNRSLGSKVDSLVKFLEEERAHRKQSETNLSEKERQV